MAASAKVIERLCSLPADFKRIGTRSSVQLIQDSGLSDDPECLVLSAVESHLRANPDLVDDWLRWSEDKRTSSGWYFSETENGAVVGFYPGGAKKMFQDRVEACAEFVVREIESIFPTR